MLVAARPGATVSEIAQKLFLSEGTVRNYLSAAIITGAALAIDGQLRRPVTDLACWRGSGCLDSAGLPL